MLCVAQFVVVLDATAVTGALPALGRELGFTARGLQWVVTAYTLTFGGFLIVGGRVADLVGSRRAFVVGLVGFTAASVCCGLASSPALLIMSRIAQGAAAALLSPAALAMLTVITAEGRERERAVGIWTAAAAGGGAAGWVLGGLLTDFLGWRWVFLVNLPIGLAALPLIALVLPRQPARRGARLDAVGAAGVTLGLGLIVYGMTGATEVAAAPLLVLVPLLVGVAIVIGVVRHERRTADPLIPLGLLGKAELRGANLLAASITASTTPAMFLAVLYVQNVLGLSPGRAALYFPALNITVIAGSLAGPRLITRLGPRSSAMVGLGLVAAGALALTTLPSHGMPAGRLLTSFALMGLGLGIASVASTTVGTGVAPATERGVASGLLNSAAQIGTAVGLAVIIPLSAPDAGGPGQLVDGMRPGFIGAALIAGLGLAAAWMLPKRDATTDDPRSGSTAAGDVGDSISPASQPNSDRSS